MRKILTFIPGTIATLYLIALLTALILLLFGESEPITELAKFRPKNSDIFLLLSGVMVELFWKD